MTDYATRFAEQAPGTLTGWTSRFAAGTVTVKKTQYDLLPRLELTGANGNVTMYSMDAMDSDASRDNVEILACLSILSLDSTVTGGALLPLLWLRHAGTAGSESGYALYYDESPSRILGLAEYSSGTATSIDTNAISSRVCRIGEPFWLRFWGNSTAMKGAAWLKDATEPAWEVEATDSTHTGSSSAGICSRYSGTTIAWHYVDFSTGATTAYSALAEGPWKPRRSTESTVYFGRSWPDLLADPSAPLELRAKIEYRDLATETDQELWVTDGQGLETGPADTPADATIYPTLQTPELPAVHVTGDMEFDETGFDRLSIEVVNEATEVDGEGLFDYLIDDSLAGRGLQLFGGERGCPQASFTPLWSGLQTLEPTFGAPTIRIEAAQGRYIDVDGAERVAGRFSRNLDVRRYVGLPRWLKQLNTSANGRIAFSNIAAYDSLASWTVFGRLVVPSSGGRTILAQHDNGATDRQCLLEITTGSLLRLRTSAGGSADLDLQSAALTEEDGDAHWYSASVLDGELAELIVDGVVVATTTTVGSQDTADGRDWLFWVVTDTANTAGGDHRVISRYMNPDEIRDMAETVMTDQNSVGTIPADHILHALASQTSGSTVTDFSANANHGTINGTEYSDWRIVPSGLGEFEDAGKQMIRTDGEVKHLAAEVVDVKALHDPIGATNEKWYRYSDRAVADAALDLTVYGGGLEDTGITDEGNGMFSVDDGAPTEPVTLEKGDDSLAAEADTYAGDLMKTVATELGGFTAAQIDEDALTRWRALRPYRSGFTFNSELSFEAWLRGGSS